MGIPLRPDPTALRTMQRRSFNRAVAAMAMTARRGTTSSGTQPEEVLRANWADDDAAGRILKAASSPLTTSGFEAIQSTRVLPQIAPDCASSKLLAMGAQIDLAGINSVRLPYIGYTGRPAAPMFVAEAAPAPVPNLSTSGAILGPTCKVLILAGISGELQSASAETAERVIAEAGYFGGAIARRGIIQSKCRRGRNVARRLAQRGYTPHERRGNWRRSVRRR
jgi:hypothetical protein